MGTDPKKINFQDKNDLIVFLNLIIELTIKHYYRYKEQCHLDKVFYDENSISYAVMH